MTKRARGARAIGKAWPKVGLAVATLGWILQG